MMLIPWLTALSVALAVLAVGWLLYGYYAQMQMQSQKQRQLNRLEGLITGNDNLETEFDQMADGQPILERFALLLTRRTEGGLQPEQDSEERLLLIRAGFRSIRSLVFFQALRLGLPIVALLLMSGYALLAGTIEAWGKVFAVCVVLYLAPKYILAFYSRRRCKRLADEIPVFVDYLRMLHGVGLNFEQSMMLFAEDSRIGLPILSKEFNVVSQAIRAGRARADALQQMAKQSDIPELRELISLINQTDRYGAGVQEHLKQFSQRLTEKKRFEMQEYVGKMATKMVVVMVLFLLPALLIVTAGPGFIAVYKALEDITITVRAVESARR